MWGWCPFRVPTVPACATGSHVRAWQICCDVLFRTAVRREVFYLHRWKKIHPKCCSHELLLKDTTKSKMNAEKQEKQLQGEVSLIYEPHCFFKGNIYPLTKKGREGKSSSWGFLECRRILSCHGNNEDLTSCSQSVPNTARCHCWRQSGTLCSGDAAREVQVLSAHTTESLKISVKVNTV